MFDWIKKLYELYREWRESRKEPEPQPEPEPEPEPAPKPPPPPAAMPDAAKPETQRRGFVWEPVSDDGRAAVLLPPDFTDNTTQVVQLLRAGSVIEEAAIEQNRTNEGFYPNNHRELYRFNQRGGYYVPPIEIVAQTKNGAKWSWEVSDTNARIENSITPTTR